METIQTLRETETVLQAAPAPRPPLSASPRHLCCPPRRLCRSPRGLLRSRCNPAAGRAPP